MRVSIFIDGFNLYHAIDDLNQPHFKWLDLKKLSQHFAPAPDFNITNIYYFTAYATWRPETYHRHRIYVKALESKGVIPVFGKFKAKTKQCFNCRSKWKDHEEKQTDVNIALYMFLEGYKDSYDQLILVSADSDLAPAIRLIRGGLPKKRIRPIIPIGRRYSWDLVDAVGGKKYVRRMKLYHLERSLLEKEIRDEKGNVIALRPEKYNPPSDIG